MAYLKKSKEEKEFKSSVKDIFNEIDKLNPDACFLNDSALSFVDDYIDTDSLALNAIISGDLYKGIPRGRITGFAGPSQSGKTLIVKKILANAQKKGYMAVVFDSENAVDGANSEGLGLDSSKVKYYPVETVEQCRNQVCTLLDRIIEVNNPDMKIIIAIDSLGNLASSKELNDIAEGKEATDMGTRAKAIKSMMRTLTFKAAKAKVPIVVTNHIYDNPAAMFKSLVNSQSGGSGLIYLASILVQLSVRREKNDEKDETTTGSPIAHEITGVTLGAMTTKNRFIPPFLKTELYLNFKTGLSKYAGLFEIAEAFKILEPSGYRFILKDGSPTGTMLGFRKDWDNDPLVWAKIIPILNEVLKTQLCYGSPVLGEEDIKELDVSVPEINT